MKFSQFYLPPQEYVTDNAKLRIRLGSYIHTLSFQYNIGNHSLLIYYTRSESFLGVAEFTTIWRIEKSKMKGFELSKEELADLRRAHKSEHYKRSAYKINVVILLGSGWTLEEVKDALLLDEETLRSYVKK